MDANTNAKMIAEEPKYIDVQSVNPLGGFSAWLPHMKSRVAKDMIRGLLQVKHPEECMEACWLMCKQLAEEVSASLEAAESVPAQRLEVRIGRVFFGMAIRPDTYLSRRFDVYMDLKDKRGKMELLKPFWIRSGPDCELVEDFCKNRAYDVRPAGWSDVQVQRFYELLAPSTVSQWPAFMKAYHEGVQEEIRVVKDAKRARAELDRWYARTPGSTPASSSASAGRQPAKRAKMYAAPTRSLPGL